MGRGRKLETIEDYQRALKAKYGIGVGVDYKPWLKIQDVKSEGVRSQIFGRKVSRVHHLLSLLESQFFYLAEFNDVVIDIREQFPLLPLSVSQKIAKTIGVKHPTHPKSGEPVIVTTDFLLTLQTASGIRYQAVSVKPISESKNQRSLEKQDIERIWWELLGGGFKYFTGNELTRAQSKNINWATSPFRGGKELFSEEQIETSLAMIHAGKYFIHDVCDCFVSKKITSQANALTLLRYLIAEKYINVDLSLNMENTGVIDITQVLTYLRGVGNGY